MSIAATRPADTATTVPRSPGALDWRIRFAVLSLIWGFSFLFIKVGTQGYAPFQVTFGRLLFGTAVLARRWPSNASDCRAAPGPGATSPWRRSS
ncbi:hypothetical protein E4K10_07265 [Streptomyces sp. T1317-0309]|nr:hypothetical protein E4K10_07265 [Streptomyces sp. T1317-0309]